MPASKFLRDEVLAKSRSRMRRSDIGSPKKNPFLLPSKCKQHQQVAFLKKYFPKLASCTAKKGTWEKCYPSQRSCRSRASRSRRLKLSSERRRRQQPSPLRADFRYGAPPNLQPKQTALWSPGFRTRKTVEFIYCSPETGSIATLNIAQTRVTRPRRVLL